MKYLPELDKKQKGPMGQNKQGVQSTKELEEEQEPHMVHLPQTWLQEISINIEDMKHIM